MISKTKLTITALALIAMVLPCAVFAEGEALSFGSAVELTGGALPEQIRDITGVGSGVSSWDYLSQKITYGYFVEVYSHFDNLARSKVDMRNGVEDLIAASYRADNKSNTAIADVKFNGDYAQHVMATEFAQRSGRGTQIANTYLINTYLPHSDGSVEHFKDGLLAGIDNQRSLDEFGNLSLKNLFNFTYDQDRRLMMGHEYDRFDHLGNKTHGSFNCTYTGDSVFYGTDETNVNKHYATYTATETSHTGGVNTITWKAGKYEGKFLRDMTQSASDSAQGMATIHRYNMKYTTPGHMTEYEEDGVVNHIEGEAGSEVPFTYKLHRSNITYNNKNQVASYNEIRFEQPPDTSAWSDDLSKWTKITTHVEIEYLDTPHLFDADVDPEPSLMKKQTVSSQIENLDGSYRNETATTVYDYDKLFKLTGGSGKTEFSGLSSDWISHKDTSGNDISQTIKRDAGGNNLTDANGNNVYEYSYTDRQTNERVLVAEADVISTVENGSLYEGLTESSYEAFYGTPVIAVSNTKTNSFGADNKTIVTTVDSTTTNTYGLVANMVKQLESRENRETLQPTLDPDSTYAAAYSMTTTYTYNSKGNLSSVKGIGSETGWEYSEEKSFSSPYTSAVTITYDIKLDKPQEKYVDQSKTYFTTAATDLTRFTSSEALLAGAFLYYNASEMTTAGLFLNEIVRRYEDEAAAQQANLKDFAPKNTASEHWALNDVGTAEYLLGCIDQQARNYDNALQHFNNVLDKYGFAQCWNPEGAGSFWHVTDAAQEGLILITENAL